MDPAWTPRSIRSDRASASLAAIHKLRARSPYPQVTREIYSPLNHKYVHFLGGWSSAIISGFGIDVSELYQLNRALSDAQVSCEQLPSALGVAIDCQHDGQIVGRLPVRIEAWLKAIVCSRVDLLTHSHVVCP